MTVRFNNLDELFMELETFKDQLNPPFVRMTIDHTPVNDGVTQVGVQLSFRIDGETHVYEYVCEEVDILGAADVGGTQEAAAFFEEALIRFEKLQISIMGGVFEG